MDENDYFLQIVKAGRVERFEADEPGVTVLKDNFRFSAKQFLFLRKGEDFGGFLIQLLEAIHQGQDAITSITAAYETIADFSNVVIDRLVDYNWKEFVMWYAAISTSLELAPKQLKKLKGLIWDRISHSSRKLRKKSKPDIRILCNPDKRNERARFGWEAIDAEVRHYQKKSQAGSHRFYLNEKRFALFYRAVGGRFFGFTGHDKDTIHKLRELFEIEWANAKCPRTTL